MATPAVLVVEDDPELRDLIVRTVQFFECTIYTAADGREAIAALQQYKPDVLVLDIYLPIVNGVAILEYLHSDAYLSHTRVIVVTASSRENNLERAEQVDYVFMKPVELRDLRSALASLLFD